MSSVCELCCSKDVTDPHTFPCLHVCCKPCLESSSSAHEETGKDDQKFECPRCTGTASSSSPPTTIKTKCGNCSEENIEVQATTFCRDCDMGLCEECERAHKRWFKMKKHVLTPLNVDGEVVPVASSSPLVSSTNRLITGCTEFPEDNPEPPAAKVCAIQCKEHADEIIKYYCRSCSVMLCSECVLFSHKEHMYAKLQDAMEHERKDLQKVLSCVEKTFEPITQAVVCIGEEIDELDKKKTEFINELNDYFVALKTAVHSRQDEIITEVNATVLSKNTHLQAQKERLDKLTFAMKLALDAGKQACQVSSVFDFFEVQGSIKQVLSSLEDELKSAQLHPVTSASIPLKIIPSEFKALIDKLPNLCTLPCQPSLCKLTNTDPTQSLPPMEIHKDVNCQLSIQAKDTCGNDLKVVGLDVKSQFLNQDGGSEDCVVIDCLNGKYIISFQSKSEGRHELHTTIGGQHIDGSPMRIQVINLKKAVLSISTKEKPMFITVDKQDRIFVTFDNGSIEIYSKDGERIRTIFGLQLGLRIARGIAIDKENKYMYVAGNGGSCLVKSTLDGQVVTSVSLKHLPQAFGPPMGLCLMNDQYILVGDSYNNCIHIFDTTGLVFQRSIRCPYGVWGLTVDNQGNIHIGGPGRVSVMSFVNNVLLLEYAKSVVSIAGDVAITSKDISVISDHDAHGQVILMDWRNDTVLTRAQGYSHPLGIFVDSAGFVYAAETAKKKILRGRLCSSNNI